MLHIASSYLLCATHNGKIIVLNSENNTVKYKTILKGEKAIIDMIKTNKTFEYAFCITKANKGIYFARLVYIENEDRYTINEKGSETYL